MRSTSAAPSRARCAATSAVGDPLPRLAQAGLELGLLAGALAQLGGRALPGVGALGLLGLQRPHRAGDRVAGLVQRPGGPFGGLRHLAVALDPPLQPVDPGHALLVLADRALGHAPLGADLGRQLGAADGVRPLVGRLAAALHQPAGVAGGLGGRLGLAVGVAQRAVGLLAGGVGLGHARVDRLDRGAGLGLGPHGLLGDRDQL